MTHIFHSVEFDWDQKNINKNWKKHKVKYTECESIFFNNPVIVDIDSSKILYSEERKIAYGITNEGRLLFVVFTIRNKKIRVISTRDMNKKERCYHKKMRN